MMRILIILLLMATQTQAGPWPREKGKVFLSYGGQFDVDTKTGLTSNTSTLYAEYGLTQKLTIGVDLGGDETRANKAIAFARLPILNDDRATKIAVEIGIGQVSNSPALRPGVSVGRGLTLGEHNGWITADTRFVLMDGDNDFLFESDFTFGMGISKRSKLIAQLQLGAPADASAYTKFAPSAVFERKPGRHIELGGMIGVHNVSAYGFKVNFWRSF